MTNFCLFLIPIFMFTDITHCRPEESTILPAVIKQKLTPEVLALTTKIIETQTTKVISRNDTEMEEDDGIKDEDWKYENSTYVDTRRILYSKTVKSGKRPYMVYLQLTKESAKAHKYRGWLCGGVIVDKYYVLTSAACVEDADRFYIVPGTTKFVDSFDYKSNDCVCKHRRKVVWKCIPKNYKFDFQDSIKWSSNDIAVVKVDKPFKIGVQETGCEFAVNCIKYNNISRELEKPGTKAFIAGWGSGSNFREGVYRRQKVHIPENAKCLQEAKVCIMDNEQCAKKWAQRFRSIITQYMICTKDVMKRLSEICEKKYANCTDVETRRELEASSTNEISTKVFNVDLGRHLRDPDDYTARRSALQGGFCENDHGGPLIVTYQGKDTAIGVISACKIDPKSHSCHGPFLYTSIFKNRQFISCAINKDVEENCRRVFRTGITHEEWTVNWDDYREDDDKADDKADDDDDDDDKPTLRQKEEEKELERKKVEAEAAAKKEASAKEVQKDSDSDSDSTEEAAETTTESVKEKEEKEDVKEEKKEEKKEKKEEKPKKSKRSKNSKKHSKKKGKSAARSTDKEGSKKEKETTDDKVEGKDKGELFYESSHDDNVNDPEE